MQRAIRILVKFAAAFLLLTGLLWGAAQFIDDAWDRRWLLAANIDATLPVLDTLMLLVTKATMPLALVTILLWLSSYGLSRHQLLSAPVLTGLLRAIGLLLALGLATSPYWYRARDMVWVYYLSAIFIPLCVEVVIASLRNCDRRVLQRVHRVLWLALAAVVLTYLVRNAIAHGLAPRPRPLSEINLDWNVGLRSLADERVRLGSSYVSGHASTVFALVSILAWCVRVRTLQIALVAWALLMAYSRLYVAAHYPYCVFMGAMLGVSAGFFTALILIPRDDKESFIIETLKPPAEPSP